MAEKESKRGQTSNQQAAAVQQGQALWKGKQVFFGDATEEVINRNQAYYEVLLHSPAQLEMLSLAASRLAEVEEMRGGLKVRPLKVRTALVMPDRVLYIAGAPETDVKAFKVRRGESSLWINLRRALQRHGLLVEPGWRLRYSVELVQESPLGGPALAIDLTREIAKEREPEPQRQSGTKGQKADSREEQEAPENREPPQAGDPAASGPMDPEAPQAEAAASGQEAAAEKQTGTSDT